jgi:hypothetical protein
MKLLPARRSTFVFLLSAGAATIGLGGCVSYSDLTPHLEATIGKTPDQISNPPLSRVPGTRDSGAVRTVPFAFSGAGNCPGAFDIDIQSGAVQSWRYPDTRSASYCRAWADTRP